MQAENPTTVSGLCHFQNYGDLTKNGIVMNLFKVDPHLTSIPTLYVAARDYCDCINILINSDAIPSKLLVKDIKRISLVDAPLLVGGE